MPVRAQHALCRELPKAACVGCREAGPRWSGPWTRGSFQLSVPTSRAAEHILAGCRACVPGEGDWQREGGPHDRRQRPAPAPARPLPGPVPAVRLAEAPPNPGRTFSPPRDAACSTLISSDFPAFSAWRPSGHAALATGHEGSPLHSRTLARSLTFRTPPSAVLGSLPQRASSQAGYRRHRLAATRLPAPAFFSARSAQARPAGSVPPSAPAPGTPRPHAGLL